MYKTELFNRTSKCEYIEKEKENISFVNDTLLKEKETEQVHLCLGFEGVENGNEHIYTLMALNNIIGGGMSSRLFQKIREEQGLVYSIYSYPSTHINTGLFTIYAGMNPEQTNKVYDLIIGEMDLLLSKGISIDELSKSKEQLKGNYILGLESTSGRMNSMGKSELLLGKIYRPDEVLQKIDDINLETANDLIRKIINLDKFGVAAVGNIKNTRFSPN